LGILWQWISLSCRSTGETTTIPDPASYTIVFNADSAGNLALETAGGE
jgi:hypothetical protein